jgi:hypothetical protein
VSIGAGISAERIEEHVSDDNTDIGKRAHPGTAVRGVRSRNSEPNEPMLLAGVPDSMPCIGEYDRLLSFKDADCMAVESQWSGSFLPSSDTVSATVVAWSE